MDTFLIKDIKLTFVYAILITNSCEACPGLFLRFVEFLLFKINVLNLKICVLNGLH